MLIMFHSRLSRPADLDEKEFYSVWLREAAAALAAPADVLKGIWKVAAKHEVYVLFEVESPTVLDQLLAELPMFKEGYGYLVDMKYDILTPYSDWVNLMQATVDRLSAPAQ